MAIFIPYYTTRVVEGCEIAKLLNDNLYSLLHLRSSGRVFGMILEYIYVPLASSVSKLDVP